MREPVYRWEALRQISKVSRVALASLLRQKDHSLQQAVHMLFPDDVPLGASQKNTVNIAGRASAGSVKCPTLKALANPTLVLIQTSSQPFSMSGKNCQHISNLSRGMEVTTKK